MVVLAMCVVSCVHRTVSRSEGEALASRLECAYFETSAAEDLSSVTTAFGRVLSDVVRLRDRQPTLQVDFVSFTCTEHLVTTHFQYHDMCCGHICDYGRQVKNLFPRIT